MLRAFIGAVVLSAVLLWSSEIEDTLIAGLQLLGWFHLSPGARLTLLFSTPVLVLVLLTVTLPRFRRPSKQHTQRISPTAYASQKDAYTQRALAALRSSPGFSQFRDAVETGRIVSAFEGQGEGGQSGEDE